MQGLIPPALIRAPPPPPPPGESGALTCVQHMAAIRTYVSARKVKGAHFKHIIILIDTKIVMWPDVFNQEMTTTGEFSVCVSILL